MPYLICNKCNTYYEIKGNDNDLSACECGNPLKFYKSIEDYMNEGPQEGSNGIFYSINKKKLVYLEMSMLKEQKETEERERAIRDLKYRIRHARLKNSANPLKFTDKDLKEKKKKLLKELFKISKEIDKK